ncbi:dephospho-CoA kinase [Nicoliella lavandulae]|uniref:Dephospho-CoA kinase n=1 Tax=Nicoliella lavandulae TaxID=3082954 RepID=A0ABU8SKR5_9LACO
MTKLVGLTGSIGTGKSTVSKMFAEATVPIIDADLITHDLQKAGTDCYQALVNAFGPSIAGGDAIDRKALGQLVFNDATQLHRLNRVMDLYIRQAILNQINDYEHKAVPLAILDAPLLFEAGYEGYVDTTVFVSCDVDKQVQRIKLRNHVDTETAMNLIDQQWSQQIKQSLSKVVINNSGSISQTKQQVLKLLENLC